LKISNCSLEIFVAEDAYVFVSHSFFISTNYNLCKRSNVAQKASWTGQDRWFKAFLDE
jgi:hypothetical protein